MCHWLGILDSANLLLLRKSCIFSRREARSPSLKGSWPWFVARMRHQLGATSRPRS
jgi:hypothetical protein